MNIKEKAKDLTCLLPSAMILMFHHVMIPNNKVSGCVLSTDKFNTLISELNNVVKSLSLNTKSEWKNKAIITFDDGIEDLYTVAYPILKERCIPFTAFISTGFIGKKGYINYEQLLEMANDPLVTIGSHGITHEEMNKCTYEEKVSEIQDSKIILEDIIGKSVEMFAYSHGIYDKQCTALVNGIGYKMNFGTEAYPYNILYKKLFPHCPRFNVTNEYFDEILRLKKLIIK